MLTREQILEIDQYCQEHKVSQQSRLDELGIGRHQYYVWKRKYRMEDEEGRAPGEFVQLRPGGDFVSPMMPPAKTSGKEKKISNAFESYLTVAYGPQACQLDSSEESFRNCGLEVVSIS